ncbi:penicillin-binding transpeptidase domain-containing protein [Helcococcus kunzii]|uniref:penicillin-binding transpeptidase domain-containing protein n=1 Tax=Helcococcus kunzii TaxID=40091 RepID=UPI0038A22BAA
MKKNRLAVIFLVFFIAFLILLSRLFDLTIINGEKYREFSDNNRMKQINIDSTRGIIYDKDGKELASNNPMYILNAYKDRFNAIDTEEKNKVLQNIVKILEEDGVNYLSNFEFGIFEFQYNQDEKYFSEKILPYEKVIEIIQENKLLKDILNSKYVINNDITFYPIKRMKDYLALRGKDIPVKITTDGEIKVEFIKNDKYKELIESKKINSTTDPLEYILSILEEDKSFINYLLSHPLSRKLSYDIMKEKSLADDIVISDIVYSADLGYIEQKANLNKITKKITLKTNAKEDFVNLVKSTDALKTVLSNSYKDENKLVVPASILINMLEKKNVNTNLTFAVDEKNNTVSIDYIENKNDSELAIDRLIRLANENKIIDDFILSGEVLKNAQTALFNSGVYPKIYLSDWEYSFIKDKRDLLNNKDEKMTAKELFNDFKKEDSLERYDDYLAYSMLNISKSIDSNGYLAYKPTTIAKNINYDSVMKIEEIIPKDAGFEVVVESNRVYPNKNSASHLLGYIGNISEKFEIEKFIEYKQYDLNDIVGKSGLEESFEDTLRGSKGKRLVYTDVYGRTTDVIEETNAVPGNNLYTTINIDFQKEVEKIVEDSIHSISTGEEYNSYFGKYPITRGSKAQIGSAVVMDVKTGNILAMVSKPDYDPNLFVNGISNYDWKKLNESNPDDIYAPRPILNNVLQSAFTPGSTFKTVTSLAALENGLNPEQLINNFGYVDVGDNRFNELIYTLYKGRWGYLNLYDALKVSSNYYFYVLGLGYNPNVPNEKDTKVSLEDIESITSRLGMQSKTNVEINYPAESSGYYPNLFGKRSILKARLKQVLDKDLSKYIKPGINLLETKLEDDIATILSWIDAGPTMTRASIVEELENMQYDTTKILENNKETLADIIKYSYVNMAKWTQSDSVNMVIGQGQNAYTPMQMVQLTGILANEGKFVHPTLVSKIMNYDNSKTIFTQTPKITETGIKPEYFKHVKEGMRRASIDVLYRNNLPFEVGSKTGTAQLGGIDPDTGEQYDDLVSEIAFAPFDKPEIAVYFSVVEGSKSKNVRAANNDIIYAYYKYVKKDSRFKNTRIGEVSVEEKNNETIEETQDE